MEKNQRVNICTRWCDATENDEVLMFVPINSQTQCVSVKLRRKCHGTYITSPSNKLIKGQHTYYHSNNRMQDNNNTQ